MVSCVSTLKAPPNSTLKTLSSSNAPRLRQTPPRRLLPQRTQRPQPVQIHLTPTPTPTADHIPRPPESRREQRTARPRRPHLRARAAQHGRAADLHTPRPRRGDQVRAGVRARARSRRRDVRVVQPGHLRVDAVAAVAAGAGEGGAALLPAAPEPEAGEAEEDEAGRHAGCDADGGGVFGGVGC